MLKKTLSSGTVHKIPADLQKALSLNKFILSRWEDLTPLARNEWICWVTFVKQEKTRKEHIVRAVEDLKKGKRRPCCWIGCTHRTDKAMNPSQKFILSKKKV